MPVKPMKSAAIIFSAGLAALSQLAIAADAPAPADNTVTQAPDSPRFDINEFTVSGDTLLGGDTIKSLVAPFQGKAKDFGDVQQALEALQEAYRTKGYSSVRVTLPEQELENGTVKLEVIEQKINSIKLEGNTSYTDENVMQALPTLKVGELPNIKEISKTLKIANQNPTKQTAVLFKDSEAKENTIDVTVKVNDEKPWKAFVNLDNTGNRESGHGRLSFGYQNFNLFGLDHRIVAQYITTPHSPDNFFNSNREVRILALGYSIPLYAVGDSIDLTAVYSDTTSSTPTALTGILGDISGKGSVLGFRYNHNLPKINAYEQQVSFSIDNRATKSSHSSINGVPVTLAPAITTTPVGLTYSGQWAPGDQQISFGISGYMNWVGIDNHGDTGDFDAIQSDDHFKKLTVNADYVKSLPKDWQLHVAYNGQFTTDHLAPIEQFRAGGINSVRGFRESVVAGDKGFRWSVEAITNNFGKVISDKADLRAVLFTDHAHVSGNEDTTGANNIARQNISSIGAGLRFNYSKIFSSRLEVGRVMDDDFVGGVGTHQEKEAFAHVSMGWQW